jgi:hypothetical protein
MAHYAFLNDNNVVIEVITGIDETELIEGLDTETWYGNFRGQVCKRTSYNNNIRGVYASVGYSYNEEEDIFVAPQPYPSWTRNGLFWEAPIPMPTDRAIYHWVEEDLNWQAVEHTTD